MINHPRKPQKLHTAKISGYTVIQLYLEGAMHCLQADPCKYTCYSCLAAITSKLANRLLYFMY